MTYIYNNKSERWPSKEIVYLIIKSTNSGQRETLFVSVCVRMRSNARNMKDKNSKRQPSPKIRECVHRTNSIQRKTIIHSIELKISIRKKTKTERNHCKLKLIYAFFFRVEDSITGNLRRKKINCI